MRKKLLAISGSTRENSTSGAILKKIGQLYGEILEVQLYTRIDRLPYFNPDLDRQGVEPASEVSAFRGLIGDADAVIICTPEYVFSLPGVLKNALEWTVSTTVFSYKPFAFIVASASGEKAFESLDLVMKTLLQVPIEDNRKLLIRGGRGKVNEAGELADENTVEEIERIMEALINQIG
jgi:NAD(P)H-dependent FMN reductase